MGQSGDRNLQSYNNPAYLENEECICLCSGVSKISLPPVVFGCYPFYGGGSVFVYLLYFVATIVREFFC